ncbi:MAG: CRISPR-associated protein Csn1 [Bacteroidales bacterium]|nr:CRISPR-associated protein Csn1 [Bacteroidales bacterium]
MEKKVLGIDTGTNSLGWAIVTRDEEAGTCHLEDHGVNIFQEGVKREKGVESSKAAERTEHRSSRKHYWRRKIRKINLLRLLIDNRFCPPLSNETLKDWRSKRIYPLDELFMQWQRTDDKRNENPYYYRYLCLTKKLDLELPDQRFILGRAIYHLNQRRGFLSNRKSQEKEEETGKVKSSISKLSEDMETAGCKYLGEYFYQLYEKGERIRNHYTAREDHYLKEFKAICEKQQLEESLVQKLELAIFYQRPLKSQKQNVGRCPFEPKKSRCPISHPLFEEFRMYQVLNNIKMRGPLDSEMRFLSEEEKTKIKPLFYRKSKKVFDFGDIAKTLANAKNTKNCAYYKGEPNGAQYLFNYQLDFGVAGCSVTAQLKEIFGEEWLNEAASLYVLAAGKTLEEIMNDIWHVLFNFEDEMHLRQFAAEKLQLNGDMAVKFSKINVPQDYASLSLCAIRKILPWMKEFRLRYDQAVFLANLKKVLPSYVWENKETKQSAINILLEVISSYDSNNCESTLEGSLKNCILRYWPEADLQKLYHPSMIELYPQAKPNEDGLYQLGSPRINSVKNPMAMHSLFRLRHVVNTLLKEGKINPETIINIEFARELNDANLRKAIEHDQRERKKLREEYRKKIEELLGSGAQVSDTDILKYQLWEEQGHQCIYTGDPIGLADFLGDNPKYDIEHTIPRSKGGDSTQVNLTLCSNRFNRDVKRTFLPAELNNHDAILQRIASWKEKYEDFDAKVRTAKRQAKSASTKKQKDRAIENKHYYTLQRDYWRGKYQRFQMLTVPEGFARRQGVDISVISRYARLYLQTVFKHVYIVKGLATSDFRKIWGIQEEYTKKERVNHVHHCIDAITIACVGRDEYGKLAQYYHELENWKWFHREKPHFPQPWETFASDIKKIGDDLLVAHTSPDLMPKQTKKKADDGTLIQGDTARGALHSDTFYGAIDLGEGVKYVVRKPLDGLKEADIKNIVDDVVRENVQQAVSKAGSLKAAVAKGIWMNEEKQIPIKKVRIYTPHITRPLKDFKRQRDISAKEYKREYHVASDRNYMMAIYADPENPKKREFELVSNHQAAAFFKASNDMKKEGYSLVPEKSKNKEYPLLYQFKVGQMVLLYESSPEEIWEGTKETIARRLYKITGLSSMTLSVTLSYGTIELVYHQEARPSTEVTLKNGAYKNGEILRSGIKMLSTQINALVEGVDFKINDLGEIIRLI